VLGYRLNSKNNFDILCHISLNNFGVAWVDGKRFTEVLGYRSDPEQIWTQSAISTFTSFLGGL
jgi:hypothetical protein